MADTYEIYPILTCKMINDQGHFTYRVGYGKPILFPVYSWLIKGAGKTILVDARTMLFDCTKIQLMSRSLTHLILIIQVMVLAIQAVVL